MSRVEVRIPDIGDFDQVDVVDVLVKPGDRVDVEDSLITLESDKASMDVPSTHAGEVREVKVSRGDKVAQDSVIVILEAENGEGEASKAEDEEPEKKAEGKADDDEKKADEKKADEKKADEKKADEKPAAKQEATKAAKRSPASADERADADLHVEVVVLGSGPGGYSAAFRAADLGLKVALVERYPDLGGVCVNVGCIPSKALLHVAKLVDDAATFAEHGIAFGKPSIDLDKLRAWKDGVVKRLTGGVASMAKGRRVEVVHGVGRFTSDHRLRVEGEDGTKVVAFDHAIIAAGSRVVRLPGLPYDDPRLMDSTSALEIAEIPERLLVIGGGIIGLEMATVYHALGAKITVVELLDRLIPGCDSDIVRPLHRHIAERYENIFLETKVTRVTAEDDGLHVEFAGAKAPKADVFDRVLLAVGRAPNGQQIGADAAGVKVDERGFIPTDHQLRTNVPHIFAIGDVTAPPMLAHKAVHEGKVAAEVIAGKKSAFDARAIPNVAYTDPEVAWVGVTEEDAKARSLKYGKGTFPWSASGRSLALGRTEGLTKILFDEDTDRILGAAAVGPHAGDLIAELTLAIEMGCEAEDIGLTIHPHPTLSETVAFSAEAFAGTITDLLPKKKQPNKRE